MTMTYKAWERRNNDDREEVIDGFLDAAQQFCEEFKEEIEKEKEEYLNKQRMYK